jgi:hypothetical protein
MMSSGTARNAGILKIQLDGLSSIYSDRYFKKIMYLLIWLEGMWELY